MAFNSARPNRRNNSIAWLQARWAKLRQVQQWPKLALFAHGSTVHGSFTVPKGLAIVFLTQPGDYCLDPYVNMLMQDADIVNDLIMQKARLVGGKEVYSVTYVEGDTCPETNFDFDFDGLTEGIWTAPLPFAFPRRGAKNGNNDKNNGMLGRLNRLVLNTAIYDENNANRNLKNFAKTRRTRPTGLPLSYIANNVVPNLAQSPVVLFVTSCRFTDLPRPYEDAKALNEAVSIGWMHGGVRTRAASQASMYSLPKVSRGNRSASKNRLGASSSQQDDALTKVVNKEHRHTRRETQELRRLHGLESRTRALGGVLKTRKKI